jgi:hypothetical protein
LNDLCLLGPPPFVAQVTHFKGQRVAADIPVWNPSFDVTPAPLIEGIITERGLVPRAAGSASNSFAVRSWLAAAAAARDGGEQATNGPAAAAAQTKALATHPGFQALDCEGIKAYVAAWPQLAKHVGSPDSSDDWQGEVKCTRITHASHHCPVPRNEMMISL